MTEAHQCIACGGVHGPDNPMGDDEVELLSEEQYTYIIALEQLEADQFVASNPQLAPSRAERAAKKGLTLEQDLAKSVARAARELEAATLALKETEGEEGPAEVVQWLEDFEKALKENQARRAAFREGKTT